MKQFVYLILALSLGLATGYAYALLNDLMILALAALAFAMCLGAIWPMKPWLSSLLLFVSIPAGAFLARFHGGSVTSSRIGSAAIVALASSVLGAYAGALTRRMVANISGNL